MQSTSPALNHPTPPPVPRRWTQAIAGGFKNVEFTLTTPDALQHVSDFRAKYDYKMVGCGTVMNVKDAEEAVDAGAEFIVSPILIPEVSKRRTARGDIGWFSDDI